MQASELFTLSEDFPFADFFRADMAPWEWVSAIKPALKAFDFATAPKREDIPAGVSISGDVYIHPSVKLPPYCVIEGPSWIGADTEIRPGAYIRGNVIIGKGCVIGNSCEFKNSLVLDNSQVPHFNYVGDSILGQKAHLGAGVICANLRLDQSPVVVMTPEGKVDTGMRKLGALVGDAAEAGCNSVLQPGSILGKRSAVISMPFNGYLEPNTIAIEKARIAKLPRP